MTLKGLCRAGKMNIVRVHSPLKVVAQGGNLP